VVGQVRRDALAALVAAEPAREVDVVTQPGQAHRDVGGTAPHVLRALPGRLGDDVDQGLTDHEQARAHAAPPGPAWSKSTDEYARSLASWWWLSISRMVPDLERMTSEWVVAPPAR
jgi:hypothetical protein